MGRGGRKAIVIEKKERPGMEGSEVITSLPSIPGKGRTRNERSRGRTKSILGRLKLGEEIKKRRRKKQAP